MVDEEIAIDRALRAYQRERQRHPEAGWPIIPKHRWLAEMDGRAMLVSGYSTGPLPIEGVVETVPYVRYRVTATRTLIS